MNAVDTNILVHAHREESPHHERALDTIRGLATGDEPWVLFWPCLYEFVRVVTHHAIFDPPTPLAQAILAVEGLCASPSVLVLGETHRHSLWFSRMLTAGDARGNLVFDAHIAALAKEHGVAEFLTADRDFRRFEGLRVTNPL